MADYTLPARPGASWAPDPTIVLVALAAMVGAVWVLGESPSAALVIVGLVITPLLVWAWARSFELAIGVLLAGSVISHYSIPLGGLNIYPEYLVVAVGCLALPLQLGVISERPVWNTIDKLLMLYIALHFFSSAFMSVAPGKTLRWALEQAVVILPYFILRYMITNRPLFEKALKLFLWIAVLQAAYAFICFYSAMVLGTEFGTIPEQYGDFAGVFGVWREPNVLGSFSASAFLVVLVLYFRRQERRLLIAACILYGALLIALSRAAVGALAMTAALLLLYGLKTRLITRKALTRIALALLGISAVVGASLLPQYQDRFSTVDVSDVSQTAVQDPDTSIRVLTIAAAFEDIARHPILGNGTASFQLFFEYSEFGYGDIDDVGAWIGNIEIRALHDTGIVGLAVFLLFALALAVRSWKMARRFHDFELLGLLFGIAIYCITFQTTESTIMAFFWFHVGLIAAALSLHDARRGGPVPAAG